MSFYAKIFGFDKMKRPSQSQTGVINFFLQKFLITIEFIKNHHSLKGYQNQRNIGSLYTRAPKKKISSSEAHTHPLGGWTHTLVKFRGTRRYQGKKSICGFLKTRASLKSSSLGAKKSSWPSWKAKWHRGARNEEEVKRDGKYDKISRIRFRVRVRGEWGERRAN